MDYREMYSAKLSSAEKLAERLESGWTLGMDSSTSQTPAIMSAFAKRVKAEGLRGIKVQTLLDVYPFEFYADSSLAGMMTGYSWFSSGGARKAINGGWADFIPAYYRDIPGHIRREYEFDAFCVAVSPMDKHGYFSLGNNASYAQAMIDKSKRIFIEVNDRQPRAVCGAQIHISQVEAIVENSFQLPVLPPAVLDETSITIGNLIAEQIPDGACIQLGIGAIPDAHGPGSEEQA